jgi:hypothetical protein
VPSADGLSALYLDKTTLIGRGLHRECYLHPKDPHRCVKIVVAGRSDENRREARYYSRLAARGISWDMLARFHGLVETSLGEGAVFDLVRDHDGSISRPLSEYLQRPEKNPACSTILPGALPALKRYLLENRVVTMTLKSKNILLQLTGQGEGKLVIVDNVGNSDFIPLSHHVPGLGRTKIRRKWRRFEQDLRHRHPENDALLTALSLAAAI